MIKIEKDLKTVPKSLTSELTKERRNELIEQGAYIYEQVYNSRYKIKDIKDALNKIYHGKCAFCEQSVEAFHVEHFRPKSIYFWLAYSWDNLLYICPNCNTHKLDKFETLQSKAKFKAEDLKRIHRLSVIYQEEEEPLFIHPEQEDVEQLLHFKTDGTISSNDRRTQYTINTCKLNRPRLVEKRKRVYDDFDKKYNDRLLRFFLTKKTSDLGKLTGLIEDFQEDNTKPTTEFLAFRRFILADFLKRKGGK